MVVEGGEQPGRAPIMLWGQLRFPNEKFWNNEKARKQCGGQSMVCVTNPITREFIVLPPIPKRRLNSKIAKFVFTDPVRDCVFLGEAMLHSCEPHRKRTTDSVS
jgi:hypothetical protein